MQFRSDGPRMRLTPTSPQQAEGWGPIEESVENEWIKKRIMQRELASELGPLCAIGERCAKICF
tara:strand:+ start:976 stop:1167 length:192 start_codon:yes stop_codon:yes gene_type:complete